MPVAGPALRPAPGKFPAAIARRRVTGR